MEAWLKTHHKPSGLPHHNGIPKFLSGVVHWRSTVSAMVNFLVDVGELSGISGWQLNRMGFLRLVRQVYSLSLWQVHNGGRSQARAFRISRGRSKSRCWDGGSNCPPARRAPHRFPEICPSAEPGRIVSPMTFSLGASSQPLGILLSMFAGTSTRGTYVQDPQRAGVAVKFR